ncbi:MAG: TolC family protein [Rubrivivax sp.]|nr:TolC family protein [Rubrivivax sp.]
MRSVFLVAALVVATLAGRALAQANPPTPALTLAEVQRLAEAASPAVRLRQAQLASAEGAQSAASRLLAHNPELNLERSSTRTRLTPPPDENARGWTTGLSQSFEIGGQQARRREAAAAALQALRAEIDAAGRQARADAALRFIAVLAAQRRIGIEQRSAELFDAAAQAVARRRAAGEDTRLDANVARVEAERALNALALARERWQEARVALAAVLQLPPASAPEVSAELSSAAAENPPYTLDQLLSSLRAMPKLRALTLRQEAARARLGLEQASRLPDVTVGLSVGRDGPGTARDRVTALTLSLPLPLFQRNDAAIGQALTELSQAEVERSSVVREQEAQVRWLWSRLASQHDRIQRLQGALLPASADNQQLATRSRQAGQIGVLDQLLVNRQALDAERELTEALAEHQATRIELENAAGWPQEGTTR